MRKLIVLENDDYVRNLLAAGAFQEIEDGETFYVSGDLHDPSLLEARGERYLGTIDQPRARRDAYHRLRGLLLASHRFRSRTQRMKIRGRPLRKRIPLKLRALPGVRHRIVSRTLAELGENANMRAAIERVRPEVVIAPTAGGDTLALDAFRSARAAGIPSIGLIYNWDNLSSKGAYPVEPDRLGVCGPQSREHARDIHRIDPARVEVLGGPYIDHHFRHPLGTTDSPFPFRYVLFAGCYREFDERTALERIDEIVERNGLGVKVVYRPHPHRLPRRRPDFVDESDFRHVVIDPQVRAAYLENFGKPEEAPDARTSVAPPLDYYPALIENAEFVICPLSTMMIESAIYERRVLVIAYDDGIHTYSPGTAIKYLHFEGVGEVEGFEVCRRERDLEPAFLKLARGDATPSRPLRDQMGYWMFHDERSYARRLADFVEEVGSSAAA